MTAPAGEARETLPIGEVTVFQDRAEVVRRGQLELKPGTQEVVIDDLPAALIEGSVRADASATVPVRLLSTDVRTVFLDQTQNPEILALRQGLEALEEEARERTRRRDSVSLRRTFLGALAAAGGRSVARAVARGAADVQAGSAISAFLAEQSEALDRETAQLETRDRAAAREREAIEKRLAALAEAGATNRRQVAVGLEAGEAGRLELEVRYQVHGCRWVPVYDLRMVSADGNTQLAMTYLAEVTQRSGEEWEGTALALSTARALGGTVVPELAPWVLQPWEPPPRPGLTAAGTPVAPAAMRREQTLEPAPAFAAARLAAAAPAMESAETASAAVEAQGPTAIFRVTGRSSVPSDGSPHKVLIGEFPLEHRIDYITAPKLAAEAYRRATITNSSPVVLLPGRAQIFADSRMIGATRIPLVPPRGELELSLGVDDRVKVKREMVGGGAEKKLLQDRRVLSHAFRIEVSNLTGRRQRVVVRDQLPISRDDRIRVRDARLVPAPTEQDRMGRLEWALDIEDGAKREISIGYTIEHPRDLRVLNLPPVD